MKATFNIIERKGKSGKPKVAVANVSYKEAVDSLKDWYANGIDDHPRAKLLNVDKFGNAIPLTQIEGKLMVVRPILKINGYIFTIEDNFDLDSRLRTGWTRDFNFEYNFKQYCGSYSYDGDDHHFIIDGVYSKDPFKDIPEEVQDAIEEYVRSYEGNQ